MTLIVALVLMFAMSIPASASSTISQEQADLQEHNLTLTAWYPQVIEYVYVNDTVNETIEYSITTSGQLTESRWIVDGQPIEGVVDGSTYLSKRTWDNMNRGFHSVEFEGGHDGSLIEFRWYVNVHEIGGNSDGSIFDVLDDALESHALDIKTWVFRFGLSGKDDQYEFIAQKVGQMQDEIVSRQMKRDTLLLEFKTGNITFEEYVASLKQVQKEIRFNMKLSKELANVIRSELNNDKLGREFENFSISEEDWAWHEWGLKYKKSQ